MRVAVACDHAGWPLKTAVIEAIRAVGHEVLDLGTNSAEPVDYPDYAWAAGDAVRRGLAERAVVLCGSGVGACIVANKLPGIRAGVCHDAYSAHQAVEHDDMNVLCLGGRVIGTALAAELVRIFLQARFSGAERHVRRLEKLQRLETEGQL